jgi:hypothetical protein
MMRWYPKEWRLANEDAMLGVLLDKADSDGRSQPDPAEDAGLMRAGIAQHFGLPQRGQRLRLLPLAAGAILSIFYAVVIIWAPATRYQGSVGPFSNPSVVTCVLLVLAFFTALLLRGKGASILALTAVGVEIAIGILSSVNQWQGPGATAVALFVGLGVLSSRPFGRGWSLTVGALLVVATAAATLVVSWTTAGLGQFTVPSLITSIVIAALVCLAIALSIRRLRPARGE